MNILGTSSQNAVHTLGLDSGRGSSLIESLQNAKDVLQNRLEKLKDSDLDSKTKQERVKQLSLEIQQVDQQIVQAKAEEQQRKAQELQEKSAKKAQEANRDASGNEETEGIVLSPSLTTLFTANNHVLNMNAMTRSEHSLEARIRTANAEIKSSAGGSIKYQLAELGDATVQLAQLQPRLAKTVADIGNVVKNSVKAGITDAKKSRNATIRENQDEQPEPSVTKSSADKTDQTGVAAAADNVVAANRENRQRKSHKIHHSVDMNV